MAWQKVEKIGKVAGIKDGMNARSFQRLSKGLVNGMMTRAGAIHVLVVLLVHMLRKGRHLLGQRMTHPISSLATPHQHHA